MALSIDPVAYWKCGEATGATRASSVNSTTCDLLDTGAVDVGTGTGKLGTGAFFNNNTSQKLTCADNSFLSMGDIDFTVALWMHTYDDVLAQTAIMKGIGEAAADHEWMIQLTSLGRIQARISDGTTSTLLVATANGQIPVAVLQWVVVEHNATANTFTIRVNNSGTLASTSAHTTGSFDSSHQLIVGLRNTTQPHYGVLDSIAIFKGLLTAGDRTTMWNAGAGAEWPWATGTIKRAGMSGRMREMTGGMVG